jgi:hypothetical protein
MKNGKKIKSELKWFFTGIVLGLLVFIPLYKLLNVDLDLPVLAAGVIVTLLGMYVVRLTVWVVKKDL